MSKADEMTGQPGSLGRPPGLGRKKGRTSHRGRQAGAEAIAAVRAVLGEAPYRRDLLIEYLHALQDRYDCLAAPHLAAVAELMRLPLAEVYEVATFYHAFDVVKEDADAPPDITVRVCDSVVCEMMGAAELTRELAERYGGRVRVTHGACMGRCEKAPVASVGRTYVSRADVASVGAVIDKGGVANGADADSVSGAIGLTRYREDGGYDLLQRCLSGDRQADEVIQALEASGLRGLGGAGFPTGRKWRFVRAEPGPRLMAVNADESEPGTFKDRFYLERDPHRFIEGMLIGAWAVEAEAVYIYLRTEYPHLHDLLHRCLDEARAAGLVAVPVEIRRGAGAYICGEESAMLESLEGKRGLPRHKPPFPSQVGLFGRPTLINNVETLYWVRDLLQREDDWFSGAGRRGRTGLRSFSVSGRVREPGVKLAPAGISARELIDEYCGGMADGHNFKAYLPGGASGGILPASMADLPLDFGTLEQHGALIGSAAVIVLSDQDSTADVALNLMRFFADESCGQCTPCRVGTEKAVQLMQAETWDAPLLNELGRCMMDASICGLGQAAPNGLKAVFEHFPEDLMARGRR